MNNFLIANINALLSAVFNRQNALMIHIEVLEEVLVEVGSPTKLASLTLLGVMMGSHKSLYPLCLSFSMRLHGEVESNATQPYHTSIVR